MRRHKVLLIATAGVLAVGFMVARPMPATAVDSLDGRYGCSLRGDGSVTLDTYYGRETSVAVPAAVVLEDGTVRDVTAIGRYAFDERADLSTITIPASITSIGEGAFRRCARLTTVEIPASVKTIGAWAFEGCSALTTATVGGSAGSVPAYAFNRCSSLRKVTLGAKVASVGAYAFSGCTSLTRVELPDSVSSVSKTSFGPRTTVRIKPAAKVSAVSPARAAATVKWVKHTTGRVSGYQIGYSRTGTTTKYTYSKGATKRSKKITRLARKKQYVFRVRPYRVISGKRYYGDWTSEKRTRIK